MPDYYMWTFPIALVGGGWILRLLSSSAKPQNPFALTILIAGLVCRACRGG